jgi:hypothetical protein
MDVAAGMRAELNTGREFLGAQPAIPAATIRRSSKCLIFMGLTQLSYIIVQEKGLTKPTVSAAISRRLCITE